MKPPFERRPVFPAGGEKSLQLAAGEALTLSVPGATCRLTATAGGELELSAGGTRIVIANGSVRIEAATVEVSAGQVRFSGVVQCDTLIANSVVAASYTPGAGNVW